MLSRALGICLLSTLCLFASAAQAEWRDALRQQIERLDKSSPGALGVYVKRLDTGETFSHNADQPWYLSSSAKVAIGIAVLQQVDAGKLRLADQATLRDTDKVDGSGELVWAKSGSRYTIDSLLTRMLGVSDNTAANLLIRTIGEDTLNRSAAAAMGKGFRQLTDFIQVRRDVYAELHPDARRLTNRQLVDVAGARQGPPRVDAVRRALKLQPGDLKARTMEEAHDRYYRRGVNAATLEGYGGMLEQLVRGKLLSPQSTQRLFTAMKFGRRGDYRLEGGIPKNVMLIHKTGTQYRRACHMAVLNPQDGGAKAVVVTTCARDLDEQREAGGIFRNVGRAVAQTALAEE